VYTVILIAVLIALFITITTFMQKLNLTPIDFSKDKVYTLSDESKERVAGIEQNVNVYFIAYTDDDPAITISKQYNKVNNKINVETIDITQRTDIAQKYGIDENTQGIIVECGDSSKVLAASELYTYDPTTYQSIDLTEEKITSAILTVTSNEIPNVYFLEGYNNDFSLESQLKYLSMYMENEILNVKSLDILKQTKVPDDCDTLVITSPTKDFEDIVANAIISYIDAGGNILWFNSSYGIELKLPNVNKVLAVYGVEPFKVGYILEADATKTITGANYMIVPNVEYTDITSKISSSEGVMLMQATKIVTKSEEELEKIKVEKTDLLTTSETAYFRTNLQQTELQKQDGEEEGTFVVGALLEKTVKDAINEKDENEKEKEKTPALKSSLIIFGENYFISDYPISSSSQTPCIAIYDNKDLALNSIAYLTDREQDITVRKAMNNVTYTATEMQDRIIRSIIFTVPCVIIIAGIVVWQVRRRKK